jgi:O-antigen/teichoic acid export membrane protein
MGKELSRINERYRKNILILGRIIPRFLMARLTDLDWTLLKGSAMISIGMLAARGLALLFYLILARVFAPGAYGEFQYSIAIAGIITIGTQPFGQHVLARFIGMHNESPNNVKRFISNAWVILMGIFIVTLALAIPVLEFLSLQNFGILVVVVGTTIFYAYWGDPTYCN